jgi:hypothetical protein
MAENEMINKAKLPKVEMPNKGGFVNAYPEVPNK